MRIPDSDSENWNEQILLASIWLLADGLIESSKHEFEKSYDYYLGLLLIAKVGDLIKD